MTKQDLKATITDMLLLEPIDIEALIFEECKDKELQQVWNNLKKDSKDLIEVYVLADYYHIISGVILSTISDKINDYDLENNENDDYIDNKGNIKFTKHDTLNVNFDSVLDTIVDYELKRGIEL